VSTTRSTPALRIPSRFVLARLPERVVAFLHAAGTHAGICAAMAAGGYTGADHREGMRLLAAVCTYGTSGADPRADEPARQAEAELSAWVKVHLRRLQTAVERLHPECALFDGIEPRAPAESVLALATLIARVRECTSASDAVRETLAKRGFDSAEKERLFALVGQAQIATATSSDASVREPRVAELVALYRWHCDWAATARALISRKEFLIALGLAGRGKKNFEQAPQEEDGTE